MMWRIVKYVNFFFLITDILTFANRYSFLKVRFVKMHSSCIRDFQVEARILSFLIHYSYKEWTLAISFVMMNDLLKWQRLVSFSSNVRAEFWYVYSLMYWGRIIRYIEIDKVQRKVFDTHNYLLDNDVAEIYVPSWIASNMSFCWLFRADENSNVIVLLKYLTPADVSVVVHVYCRFLTCMSNN